jgi:hypothetical protein
VPTLEYGLNGVNTQVEYDLPQGSTLRRAAWGTLVEQPSGTSNWFHLAPTTPVNGVTENGYFQLWLDQVVLRCRLREAQIDQVHIRNGAELAFVLDRDLPIAAKTVNLTLPGNITRFKDDPRWTNPGLLPGWNGFALAVHVEFGGRDRKETPQVIFNSAFFRFFLWGNP